jgi:lipoprotein NlpD
MSPLASTLAQRILAWGAAAAAIALAGCASRTAPAPVENRPVPGAQAPARTSSGTAPAATPPAASAQPGGTRAGSAAPTAPSAPAAPTAEATDSGARPGFYAVRPGDTLGRIALDHGQSWRDLARWNGLDNPNLIEVGQQLRVVPPGTEPGAAVARPVSLSGRVESRPLDGRAAASAPAAGAAPGAAAAGAPGASGSSGAAGSASAVPVPGSAAGTPASSPQPPTVPGATASAPAARESEEDVAWAWPAAGPVLGGFDEARQAKGLSIGGKAGDPVLAAADGRVVYAGAGLRGYGNLVIVKHNALFLSAYAHNQTLLVKEDQVVRRGQKIAEMGSSESERVHLHFEIRRQGRPIDPSRLLPQR